MHLQHFPAGSNEHINHGSHARPGIHPFRDRLHVITMMSNPLRWRSRYANYWKFAKHCEDAGAILYTAEIAFGDRAYEVTESDNPRHLQLQSHDEIWHKENAQNLMLARIPREAKYIAFVDADITFTRTDWAQETLHLLQHHPVVQMYSHLKDVDSNSMPVNDHIAMSAMHVRHTNGCPPHHTHPADYHCKPQRNWGCPGGAWAYRRECLDWLGGLMDWIIVGSADYYMLLAMFGELEKILLKGFSESYCSLALAWQERALKHIQKNVGCVPGMAIHHWHGPKSKRGYEYRPAFLAKTKFCPVKHLKRDAQGLYQLDGDNLELRDGLRHYARLRDEDQG